MLLVRPGCNGHFDERLVVLRAHVYSREFRLRNVCGPDNNDGVRQKNDVNSLVLAVYDSSRTRGHVTCGHRPLSLSTPTEHHQQQGRK